jgi:hypothetical protein
MDVLLYGPGWLAAALVAASPYLERRIDRRFRRLHKERWGVPYEGS